MKRADVGLVLLAVAAAALTVAALTRTGDVEAAPTVIPSASPAPVTALFFGDSITEGKTAGANGVNMPQVAAKLLGWKAVVRGAGSTGYTTAGTLGGQPFPDRAQRELTNVTADVIVIQGGTNDSPTPGLEAAVRATLTVAKNNPESDVLVVGPYVPGEADAAKQQVDDVIGRVAASLGLRFASPIDEGWMTGAADKGWIGPDGFHPSAAGYEHLGEKLADSLRKRVPQN